jgi:hypothetical protein
VVEVKVEASIQCMKTAPQSTDWLTLSDSGTGSGSGGSSSSQKQSKRTNANEKNLGYPPREYTAFARPVAMRYYAHKDMDMLECTFLDNGLDGYVDLCKDLCCEFMEACDTFEKYNYLDYWDHVKWIDTIVTINTTNVVKGTFEVLYPNPRKNSLQNSIRSKQHAGGTLGIKQRR